MPLWPHFLQAQPGLRPPVWRAIGRWMSCKGYGFDGAASSGARRPRAGVWACKKWGR